MLEVNNNNLKFQKYTGRRNEPIKHHVIRHIIKSNDSIALVWDVAFELQLLSTL